MGLLAPDRLLAQPPASSGEQPVADSNVAVPMRDGVVLRADVWRPARGGRYPTLVFRTPYGKHQSTLAVDFARKAVTRGYAVVLQDVRGRYASGGEFLPYQQEGRDGYDTIEWAAAQRWSNGAVGTFGLSYPGAVQWLAAVESPPHLKAMVPAMTFARPTQFWYSGGAWDNSWMLWIRGNILEDRAAKLGGDTAINRVAPWHFEWQRHPPEDPWWHWADLSDKYGKTNAAVLNVSGWHDDAYGPDGATRNFAGLVSARRRAESAATVGALRTALVMGPWTHGVPRLSRTTAGERDYGRAGAIDYDEMVLRWMDHFVKGVDNGVASDKPVRVFVMGSNRWIEADGWPVPGTVPDTLEFRELAGSGSSVVTADPANPVTDKYAGSAGAHDYRDLAARPDVALFETPPLDRDLTVVGAMKAEISVSVESGDADIWVKVLDVAPNGTALNLMSPGLDLLRASYRNGTHEPLVPGAVYTLRLADLLTTNTFKKGHRIRVVVMPGFAPHFTSPSRGRITIHHGERHGSRLILPVLPEARIFPSDR